MRIDQWVPALHRGDAIGDSARLMRDAFRSWGHTADVYALDMDEDLAGDGLPFDDWRPGRPEDIVFLHYALPSPLTEALKSHRGRRGLIHHNITPPEFFEGYDPEMARICAIGRADLGTLAGQVDLALGDSEFNRRELEQLGFRRTAVLPIYLDFVRYRAEPNPVLMRLLRDGRPNLLFVGRIAPNKCHADLIRVASYWRKFIAPDVRLLLPGKLSRRRTYFDALQAFLYEEGFTPADVVFAGHVSHADLLAYYRTASVFLSMSVHEGFGVPLVEAMLMDVPILAYRCTAIGDTLGDAGAQFLEKRIDLVAEMARELQANAALRGALVAGQRQRLEAFAPDTVQAQLKAQVAALQT